VSRLAVFSCDLSDTGELTDTEGDNTTETDSSSTESSLEDDSTTDHNSDSDLDLWEGFNFPQLTAEEDAQLTIALQGGISQPTTSFETSTSMSPLSQEATGTTEGLSGLPVEPSSSPPPYMTESDDSQLVNPFFLVNNSTMSPISSTDGQFYVTVDRVYCVIRQM